MQLIQIGKNGPKVAAIGVGCWAWGDAFFWGYGRGYTKGDLKQAFDASLAEGITFFDTAEAYGRGQSERLLGEFSAAAGAEVVIASKFFPYPWRALRGQLPRAAAASRERLGVPAIQLYQQHWPFPPRDLETWMHAMADAVEAGLIKQAGVSNFSPRQLERAYRVLESRGLHLASNQVSYSLLDRRPEHSGLLQLCKDLDVTLIAYSPLAQGLLTGKYGRRNRPRGLARNVLNFGKLGALKPLLEEMLRIGLSHDNKTPGQVALNWCVAKGTLAIPGAKNARQAKENAGALGWSLTAEEIARLDELT
jgi:aryl-alcohol dehydrogenase-like predicted oxidoreductase